ncbi:hypothetical protein HOU08_gp244 [Dickeya phage vB_DsoM_JA29]|uniref:Uncharacterized protein n=1 Tax=Dickeya phage vB_DsoM_JA29 TaxID=2283031 RepID=A0A384ZXI5_9CAUD|nr:hypothetical protein HOU08_gp244 [Dickeya phage vB_DsoM_JA29]AXG66970.1 hypothetical protein JA29_244 [Dickeya phage vB_DsoM_JA29]
MPKLKKETLFDSLHAKFFTKNPCAQMQDILRIVVVKPVNSLHFKLVMRPAAWNQHEENFREISIRRAELHYVDIICTQGTFADSTHAETMEQAMDAIYKYLSARSITRTKLFDAAAVYAHTLKNSSAAGVSVSDCIDRIIIRDLSVNYSTELHITQNSNGRIKMSLYANGELSFCTEPQTEQQLIDKATYVLFGGGPVEDALPKLLRHEVKAVTQMLEKYNVNLNEDTITFKKEDFFSFVGDLVQHKTPGKN